MKRYRAGVLCTNVQQGYHGHEGPLRQGKEWRVWWSERMVWAWEAYAPKADSSARRGLSRAQKNSLVPMLPDQLAWCW